MFEHGLRDEIGISVVAGLFSTFVGYVKGAGIVERIPPKLMVKETQVLVKVKIGDSGKEHGSQQKT